MLMWMLSVPAHRNEVAEADEVEDHHAGGGLRERVPMGSHLNDRQVNFPPLCLFGYGQHCS